MKSLTELANEFNSDKGDTIGCRHRYAEFYEQRFEPLRDQEITFLEIGLQRVVCQGEIDCPSLKMWLEFFSNANIVGLDIADFSSVELPRTRIFQGDQSDPNRLEEIAGQAGPFDIIIDDGSHASAHQQVSLATLFAHLKPGGLYIIEDTHWQPDRKKERLDRIPTTLHIFKQAVVHGQLVSSQYLDPLRFTEVLNETAKVVFSHPDIPGYERTPVRHSMLRNLARRIVKRNLPLEVDRRFKLIVLEKAALNDGTEVSSLETRLNPV